MNTLRCTDPAELSARKEEILLRKYYRYHKIVVAGQVAAIGLTLSMLAQAQGSTIPWNQNFGQFSTSTGFTYLQQSRASTTDSNTESFPNAFSFVFSHRFSVQAAPSIFKSTEKGASGRHGGFGDTNFSASYYLTTPDQAHTFAAVFGYAVKVPTSNRLVSTSRELDHVISVNLQDAPQRFKQLTLQLEPGIGLFGKNGGGELTKGVLSLRESLVLNPARSLKGGKWTLKNDTGCYSAASNSPTDCTDTLRLSHVWRVLSGTIDFAGGTRIGLTPFSPRLGFVVSLSRTGSFVNASKKDE